MKYLVKKISAVVLMALSLAACRKESDRLHDFSYHDVLVFNDATKSFGSKFKILWEGLNSNYAIWDYEAEQGLDWDKVYDTYYPRFAELDTFSVRREVKDEELLKLLTEVLGPLHDGHLCVSMKNHSTGNTVTFYPHSARMDKERAQELADLVLFDHPTLSYYMQKGTVKDIKSVDATFKTQYNDSQGAARKWVRKTLGDLSGKTVVTAEELTLQQTAQALEAELDALKDLTDNTVIADAFNKIALRYGYLQIPGFHTLEPALTDKDLRMTYALLEGNIAYLSFNKFIITPFLTTLKEQSKDMEPYAAALVQQAENVWASWFYAIQELHASGQLGGVIIDVRCNGGGMTSDYAYALGALVPSGGHHVSDNRFKRGVGRYDYSPITPEILPTYEGEHVTVTEPIVVLANGRSASMAETTSLGTRRLENAKLVGTRTWGGMCSIADNSVYSYTYAGHVGVAGETPVTVYCPAAASLDLDGTILEGVGITPDIEVPLDMKTWNLGLGPDSQLDRAIEYIVSGK